jgi:hypothetical protein
MKVEKGLNPQGTNFYISSFINNNLIFDTEQGLKLVLLKCVMPFTNPNEYILDKALPQE